MGRPAVSFFPGNVFLAVDEEMIANGWMFKSRNVKDIFGYVEVGSCTDTVVAPEPDNEGVRNEVLGIFDRIIAKHA